MTQIGEGYIANLKLKKRKFGGVDAIDAINHLDVLSKQYEQFIAGQAQHYTQALAEKDQQLQQAYTELQALQAQLAQMPAAAQTAAANDDWLRAILYAVERIEQRLGQRFYGYHAN